MTLSSTVEPVAEFDGSSYGKRKTDLGTIDEAGDCHQGGNAGFQRRGSGIQRGM